MEALNEAASCLSLAGQTPLQSVKDPSHAGSECDDFEAGLF
jgi:hypothetical protein